jgi:hypothetical protein
MRYGIKDWPSVGRDFLGIQGSIQGWTEPWANRLHSLVRHSIQRKAANELVVRKLDFERLTTGLG